MIRRSTWVVLGIFGILLAAVLILQKTGKLEPAVDSTPNPTEAALFGLDTGNIIRVQIEIPNGDSAAFSLNADGTWAAVSPEGFQPDESTVNSALGQISTWKVQNELNVAPPLEAIGLNSPSYLITYQMDSGQEHKIQIGSLNPAQTGYYLQVDGGAPLLVNRYSVDPVLELMDLLHITPTPPPADTLAPDFTPTP